MATSDAVRLADFATEWNRRPRDWVDDRLAFELFAARAVAAPAASALVQGQAVWTYRRLLDKAQQLAGRLVAAGVGPEELVAIALENPLDQVVAMLAVSSSGAGFLPLDPAYPQDRLTFMLADSGSRRLICRSSHAEGPPGWTTNQPLEIFDWNPVPAAEATPAAWPRPDLRHPAYAIYTSGSTGRPKGILIEQGELTAMLTWGIAALGLSSTSRVLHCLSFSFDFGIFEALTTLLAGGTLFFGAPGHFGDALASRQDVADMDIDTLHATPSFARELLHASEDPLGLEVLHLGGEAIRGELVAQIAARVPAGCRVFNGYGPTEATINSSLYRIDLLADPALPAVPIGRNSANHRLYVVGPDGELTAPGAEGELWIGGGLARGYLGQPALTAATFVPDPWSNRAGERLYRSGDRIQLDARGELVYLGRLDQQVKLRGFRIECGEIEACLLAHPAVKEAAVVPREFGRRGEQLVAYLVLAAEAALEPVVPALQAALSRDLPAHFLPAHFLRLERLPRTPSGKTDRAALSNSALAEKAEVRHGTPGDATQARLCLLLADVFGANEVGPEDSFLSLGGHSLLATRLLVRIEKEFGVRLPLAALFAEGSIADLARRIQGPKVEAPSKLLWALRAEGRRPPLFLVHPVMGTLFQYLQLLRWLSPEQRLYGFQSPGLDGEGAVFDSLETMATAYLAELQQQEPRGPYQLGGWSMGGVVAWEMAHQLQQQGEAVALLALFDSTSPLDRRSLAYQYNSARLASAWSEDLGAFFGKSFKVPEEALAGLKPEAQWEKLCTCAETAGVLPQDADRQHLRGRFQVFLNHAEMLRDYLPPKLDLDILLFRAEVETAGDHRRPGLGWEDLAHSCKVIAVPGDHLTLFREPHLPILARRLEEQLAAIDLGGVRPSHKVRNRQASDFVERRPPTSR